MVMPRRGAQLFVPAALALALVAGAAVPGCQAPRGPYLSVPRPAARGVADDSDAGSAPAAAPTDALPEVPTLDDYLAYAALRNAGLEAAFQQWRAALAQVPQARSLPDPRFNYRYFIENVETRVGPQRHKFGLAQTFPWFGTLRLRGDVAMAQADAAQARYDAKKLELFYRVKQQYYEYYYLRRAVAVVEENRRLVEHLEQVARTRFKTATADHSAVIRAQVELGKLDDQLRSLEALRGPRVAQLNAV